VVEATSVPVVEPVETESVSVVEPVEATSVSVVEPVETTRPVMDDLTDPEDAKLLILARAHRARAGSSTGAAVRDTDGRTYSAAQVDLPSLRLSAVQLAVALAATSGVRGLEAVVVVGADELAACERDLVRDFAGDGVPIFLTRPSGDLVDTLIT
jgi:cytidine deaminase